MTMVLLAGPDDDGLGAELAAAGVEVTTVDGIVTADALERAGAETADLFVLTDLSEATSIPVVKDLNPDIRVVVYSHDSLPEFVTALTDLAVDPALVTPGVMAEELAAG